MSQRTVHKNMVACVHRLKLGDMLRFNFNTLHILLSSLSTFVNKTVPLKLSSMKRTCKVRNT